MTLSINTVYKPHKDCNTLERDSVLIGLSKFDGGQLWLESETGSRMRVTGENEEPRPGVIREVSHNSAFGSMGPSSQQRDLGNLERAQRLGFQR